VPPQAAKEFLAKGSKAALDDFLRAHGVSLVGEAEPAVVANLQAQAASLGRSLSVADARIAACAVQCGAPLLTADTELLGFMEAIGHAVERFK
jgi:predicted nucleic acid-binding protein